MRKQGSAVVLLSGGQDSTTVFYGALERYELVEAASFDYGQRHRIELELAAKTAGKNGVDHFVIPINSLAVLSQASLTNPDIANTEGGTPATTGWHAEHDLPPSFVPGRNLLFFTLAAAHGIPRGINEIVTGVCQQDRAGYPDCRSEFVLSARTAIARAMDTDTFGIWAPLLNKSKAETWQLADELGVLPQIILETHTCYEGTHNLPAPWGYGCGECGACVERKRGYDEFMDSKNQRRLAEVFG